MQLITCKACKDKWLSFLAIVYTEVILDNLCEGGRMVQIVPRVLSKPSMADGNSGNSCPSRGNYCSSHLLLATIQAMARAKNPKMGKLPEWTFHLSALLFQHSDDKERLY